MKYAEVYVDGRLVAEINPAFDEWKREHAISLGPALTAGEHELRITVVNRLGPPLLMAHSDALGVYTGADWEASLDDSTWTRAIPASTKGTPELSRMFPSTGEAVRSQLYILLPLFALVFLVSFTLPAGSPPAAWIRESMLLPSRVRWVLIGFWVVLAINNIRKLPLTLGYDAEYHYEYISYIVKHHRIPLASEGWQMFQSPLYYLISAGWYSTLSAVVPRGDMLNMLMRVPSLVCGVLLVEVVYRTMNYTFPARKDLQVLGTVVGGLLPMNIYISQYVGNEPLAGLLSAVVVLMSIRLFRSDDAPIPQRYLLVLGLVLGLAMLAKATAVLLCLPLAAFLVHRMLRGRLRKREIALKLLLVFGIAFSVCGWYYLRNWVELGKPFVGGWDLSRSILWWQDPGYRTIRDFLAFGASLRYPVYAGVNSVWDSIYTTFWMDGFLSSIITFEGRPPWNYHFMISGALLSLLPSAGMLLGIVKTSFSVTDSEKAQLFPVTCIGMYVVALVYMYLTLPIYTTAKATYTLGITPCYALVCVTGLDLIMRNRFTAALVHAIIASWGVFAYGSFFVVQT
jgi:hypothetical protein